MAFDERTRAAGDSGQRHRERSSQDDRLPPGWWIIPGALFSLCLWGTCLVWLVRLIAGQ